MKKIGFLSFGHWTPAPYSDVRTASDALDETGEPLHVQQRKQIEAYREVWKEAGHGREPRVSVSRSIFALVDDRDRAYFGRDARDQDQVGYIDEHAGHLRSLVRRGTRPTGQRTRGR